MDDKMKELERIQNILLGEADEPIAELVELQTQEQIPEDAENILSDEELNALLYEETAPAFEDPEKINDPDGEMVYNNFANDYGNEDLIAAQEAKAKNDKIVIGLMLVACALCLGIIGVLIYWLKLLP